MFITPDNSAYLPRNYWLLESRDLVGVCRTASKINVGCHTVRADRHIIRDDLATGTTHFRPYIIALPVIVQLLCVTSHCYLSGEAANGTKAFQMALRSICCTRVGLDERQ